MQNWIFPKELVILLAIVAVIAATPIVIHYWGSDTHYSEEDIAKIYTCGRAGGEVIEMEDELGCLIDGQNYEMSWNPEGRISATSTSQ